MSVSVYKALRRQILRAHSHGEIDVLVRKANSILPAEQFGRLLIAAAERRKKVFD